jgi:hypothetical protein
MQNAWGKVVSGLAAVALVAAIGAFAWNVTGMDLSIGLARQVEAGRAQWQEKGSKSYRAIVRFVDFNQTAPGDVTVVVKDGALIEAVRSTGSVRTDLTPEDGAFYTIESLFDYAAAQTADVPEVYVTTGTGYRYLLRLNSDLGYIEAFRMDICGKGPLAMQTQDCRWGFEVIDVRLDE